MVKNVSWNPFMVSLLRVELREADSPCDAEQRPAPPPMRRLACDIIAPRDPARHERRRWLK
jgi:hypothetical protein